MRIMGIFILLLYGFLFFLLGILVVLVGANIIPFEPIAKLVEQIYTMPEIALGVSAVGIVVIMLDIVMLQMGISSGIDKKRTYTIKKDDGDITISLFSPIDAIIKEIRKDMRDIVQIRHDVVINKKKLNIDVKMVVKPGVSIPELISEFQQKVSERVKEIVGIDMPIMVNVSITKVSTSHESKDAVENIPIPYRAMDV